MRRVMIVLCVSAWLWVAGCGGPKDPWAGVVSPDVLAKADLKYYWRQLADLEKGEKIERFYRMDENLYLLTDRNRLVCYSAQRGVLLWASEPLADPGRTVFRPFHADRMMLTAKPPPIDEIIEPNRIQYLAPFPAVLINTETRLYVFNRQTGELLRNVKLTFPANTGGATDGRLAFLASTRGWCYMIRLLEVGEFAIFSPDVMIAAPLECRGGLLYIGDTEGDLFARRLTSQGTEEAWTRKLSGPIMPASVGESLFQVTERGMFVPCVDNRLYAFDPATGLDLWPLPFIAQGAMKTPVQLTRQTVFQFAQKDKFYAINLANGQARWTSELARRVLGAMDGTVCLLDVNGNLLIADEMLGTVRHSLPLTGFDRFASNASAPAVWVASADGKLACMAKSGTIYLKPEWLNTPVATSGPAPATPPK